MSAIRQDSYLRHFPKGYSKEIRTYINESLFPHYIFTDNFGDGFVGYCTQCGSSFPLTLVTTGDFYKNGNLKHNAYAVCPECHAECTAKNASRGHKTLIDEVYCIYYEKSILDPKIMVARGIYAVRDYRGDYTKTKTIYATKAYYYFEMGNTAMFERYVSYWGGEMYRGEVSERKKLNSLVNLWPYKKPDIITSCCFKSVVESVEGTPFQYSCYERFDGYGGYVTYFDLYSKYPVIEKLIKIDFEGLIETKLNGNATFGAVNWNAKTVQKALRLNKGEIKLLKSVNADCRILRLYQIAKKHNSIFSKEDLKSIRYENIFPDDFNTLLQYASFRKVFDYIKKQSEARKISFNYLLSDYKDYISDCVELEKNLKDKSVLFPKDLMKAHAATTKLLKAKTDAIINQKIIERAKKLQKYCFEFDGLMIRPAESQAELIKEGNALNHCVATRYSKPYANGETNILLIRKTKAPDKPFYTLELQNNSIIQCRGKNNKDYSEDKKVEAFVKAFEAEKLTKKSIKITA